MSSRWPALFLGAAAVLSLGLGLRAAASAIALSGGLLSLLLPWAGAAAYAALTVAVLRRPASPWTARGLAAVVFIESSLTMEMLVDRRLCPGCLAVASLAALAAVAFRAGRWVEAGPLAAGAALGAVVGSLSPFDAADAAATRVLWPAKILAEAPAFVDRRVLAGCEHASLVRILIYEKDCKG